MTFIIAFLAVAMIQDVTPSPGPTRDDARAVAELILADEARIHGNPEDRGACVRLETAVAFGRERYEFGMLARDIEQATEPQRHLIQERLAQVRQYGWRRPGEAGRAWAGDGPIDAAEARSLSESASRIVHADAPPRLLEQIDPSSLPAAFRPCRNEGSRPFLELSSPAFDGDAAFVETAYVCGGLCGNGFLYALRRTAGGWRIVAVSSTWIS